MRQLIGLTIDAALGVLATPTPLAARVAFLLAGTLLLAMGSGLSIGVPWCTCSCPA